MAVARSNSSKMTFRPTGATCLVGSDGTIHLMLGPRRTEGKVDGEAAWVASQLQDIAGASQRPFWNAIIDLRHIPSEERPSHAMRDTYSMLVQDERLHKVAIINTQREQRAVLGVMLLSAFLPDKVHFFANEDAASDWLSTRHPASFHHQSAPRSSMGE